MNKQITFFIVISIIHMLSFLLYAQEQIGLDIDGEVTLDESGHAISLSSDGSRVAIGGRLNDGNGSNSGHVRVYEHVGQNWIQIGADINGEAAFDESGHSVAISSDGSRVAIGAPGNDNGAGASAGHVRVYQFMGNAWAQVGGDIDGEADSDRFGWAVSISSDGTKLAVGAIYNDGNGSNSGHVRVFELIGNSWTQLGGDIDGEESSSQSGRSVALSSNGNRVAIGAPFNSGSGGNAGHVRIFDFVGGNWIQLGADIDGEAAFDESGMFVSLSDDGSRVAIGAPRNDGTATNAGHVRVYELVGATWTQLGQDIDGEAFSDASGTCVSLSSDGNRVAIGAPENGNANGADSGQVRVYDFNGNIWTQLGADIDGESTTDLSGWSVSISGAGSVLTIGAPWNDDNGADSGHVRVYDPTIILSVASATVRDKINLFPNPGKNIVNINLQEELQLINVAIYNTWNQYVLSSLSTEIVVSSLVPGTYFLEVRTNKGTGVKKLLIE